MRDELLKKRYERHVQSCSRCQEELAEYQDIIRSLERPLDTVPLDCETNAPKVIPFKSPGFRNPFVLKRTIHHVHSRIQALSVSATIAAITFAVLIHTGHLSHMAMLGDAAWDHVTHTVTISGEHLRHHIRRL
jgi:hypothetical protein